MRLWRIKPKAFGVGVRRRDERLWPKGQGLISFWHLEFNEERSKPNICFVKFTSVKVSNNALNFLLAQYRAIFKRAYVKGLASAVLLTAGLAAGQAQADAIPGGADWENAASVTVDASDKTFSGSSNNYFNDITINGSSGHLTVQGDTSAITVLNLKGTMTVNEDAQLTVSGGNSTGTKVFIAGWDAGADANYGTGDTDADHSTGRLISYGTLTLGGASSASSHIELDRVVLHSGSETTLEASSGSKWDDGAVFLAGYSAKDDSDFVIEQDADVTLKNQSLLGVGYSTNGDRRATLDINGNVNLQANDAANASILRANDVYSSTAGWNTDLSLNSKIEIGSDAVITVSGHGIIASPETNIAAGAEIDVQSGTLTLNGDFLEKGKAANATSGAAGVFNMAGGTLNIDADGTVVVAAGTYTHDDDRTSDVNEKGMVTSLTLADGTKLTGTGKVQVAGKFAATAGIVDAFLSGKDANGTTNSNDGKFEFSGNSSVFEVTGSDLFDLAKYNFSGSSADGVDFILTGSGTIAGENLAVSKALTKNGSDAADDAKNKLLIDATSLTLGSDTYTGTGTLNFHSATARNLTLQGSGNSFTLADKVTVAAIDEVDNPFLTKEGKLKVAADGQLNLEDNTTITGGDTKGLTIAAGNFESNADVTIKSGALTVGNQTTDTDEGYGVDASLALSGKLTLDNSTGANTITIAGNGSQSITTDDGSLSRTASATLDLTGVRDVVISGHASNLTTLNVNAGGELLLSTNAFNKILDVAGANTQSGAGIVVSGGYTYVEGSIQGADNAGLDATLLVSGSAASGDKLVFSGDGGTLEARDTIWLEDKNGSGTLNIGDNELKAQTFRLDGFGTTADNKTTYAPFKVESGILTAGARVESSHDNAIQLGNGTDSGATLNLGYIDTNYDEWGQETGTYTTSSATGSVDTNLVLSGAAASKSALNVVYGDWSAKDIAVTNGTVKVGDTDTRYDADHNEVVYNASLTGNKLTLGTGAEATVNSNGKATFNELTMTAGTLTVNGEMTVNGNHVLANTENSTPESWGVSLTAGEINVSGRNARLTFGGDAVSAISIDSDNKGVTVQTGTFGQTIDVKGFATLGLNFAEGTTFNADTLKDLRTALLRGNTGAALTEGYINLGAARIEGVTVSDGKINWEQLKDFADIDQLQDIITDDMSNATLVNANGTDTVQGNVGNIQLAGNQQTVQLGDSYLANSSANNENGNFVFNETNPAQAGNANIVGGAHVTLANGGNIGAVSLATGNSGADGETILNVVSQDPAAETNITSISAGDNSVVNISATTNVAQQVNADDLQVDAALTVTGNVDLTGDLTDSFDTTGAANGALTAANLSVDGVTAYHGNLDIAGNADFAGETYLSGNNKFATRVTFDAYTELDHGTTDAGRVVLNGTNSELNIIGDAVLNAQVIDAAAGQTIFVGEESSTEVGHTGEDTWESSTGYLFAERVDLNGATIMADPAYGKAASMVGIGQLGDTAAITTGNDAGTLNGNVIALRNSIMAIGVSDTEEATVREQLQSTFAQYLDANGSLDADGVGSILYVAEALDVDAGSKLIVDSKRSFTSFANDSAQTATGAYGNKIDQNDVYIGENSALALGEAAALTTTYGNAPRAALDFDKAGASLYAEKNAKILLVGSDFSIHSDIHLFSDNDGNGIMINGNNVTVSTMNNLLIDTLEQGKEAGSIKLSLNRDAVGSAFYAASTPVKNTLIAYAANDLNWADTSTQHVSQQLLGDRVANVTWDGTNFKTKEGDTERTLTAEESADLTYDVVGYNENDQPIYGVFEKGYNYFLDQVARDSKSGSEAETVARLGVYGGAPQAAIKAGQSSTDAIAARFGIGSALSNLTVAGNTQGAALWLAPVYKTSDSDGFDAQGVDYGVNVDLYGVALGADYTLANGIG